MFSKRTCVLDSNEVTQYLSTENLRFTVQQLKIVDVVVVALHRLPSTEVSWFIFLFFCFIAGETNPSLETPRSSRRGNWDGLLKGRSRGLTLTDVKHEWFSFDCLRTNHISPLTMHPNAQSTNQLLQTVMSAGKVTNLTNNLF